VEFSHHVLRGLQQVISNSILVALSILAILLFDIYLFGMLLLMLLPAIALLVLFARKRLTRIRQNVRLHREKTIQYLNEALSGFIEANLYQRKEFFISRYRSFQEKYNADLARQQVMLGLPSRFMEVFAVLGLFLLIVIDTYILQSEHLLLLIGAFMAAAYKIIPGVVKILNHLQQIRIYSTGIEELANPGIEEEKQGYAKEKLRSIELDNLRFAYQDRALFTGLSFRMEPGGLTGLSAPSGQGKTTLLHLLLGFLEPASGNIFFNDSSTTAERRRSFWPRISYIPQQPFLIHDSIQHNIALTEKPDMEDLWRAVTASGLHSFVSEAEKGLESIITENGKNISGGQRQRMMMARALYRDADLYILDEPFGELDRAASTELLGHLQTLAGGGKMVLLITHDEQALAACSKIIRFNER
jgi:ABC-type multidrug transport system fused ATPase/permease subunit